MVDPPLPGPEHNRQQLLFQLGHLIPDLNQQVGVHLSIGELAAIEGADQLIQVTANRPQLVNRIPKGLQVIDEEVRPFTNDLPDDLPEKPRAIGSELQ